MPKKLERKPKAVLKTDPKIRVEAVRLEIVGVLKSARAIRVALPCLAVVKAKTLATQANNNPNSRSNPSRLMAVVASDPRTAPGMLASEKISPDT